MERKSVGLKIKEAVKEAGFTQTDFERKLDIGENLISRWASGDRTPSIKSIKKIAKALKKPLSYFLDDFMSEDEFNKSVISLQDKTKIKKLPIVATVNCGLPDYCNYTEGIYEDFMEVSAMVYPDADFIIRCQGDSMIPTIPPDAYCIIKKIETPLNNKIMLVKTENGYTIKKVVIKNGKVQLHYLNPADKIIMPKEILIVGKIIGIHSKID